MSNSDWDSTDPWFIETGPFDEPEEVRNETKPPGEAPGACSNSLSRIQEPLSPFARDGIWSLGDEDASLMGCEEHARVA